MWLRKADNILEPEVMDVAIPFSVLEEVFDVERPEVERVLGIENIKEYFVDPAVRAEVKEQLQDVYEQLKEGDVPNELFTLEQQLFNQFVEKHPEQIKEKGVDVVHDSWRRQFVSYLQDVFLSTLKAEIEKEGKSHAYIQK